MARAKDIDRPYILEIDLSGENFVIGIANVKDALKVFNILGKNGYHVTIEALSKEKEKTDEQDQGTHPEHE